MSYTFLSSSKVFRIFCDFSASFLLRFHHVHHVLCWNGTMVPILTPRIHDDSYCSCCSYSVTEKTGLTHYPTANTLSAGSIWCLQSTSDVLLRGRKTLVAKFPCCHQRPKVFSLNEIIKKDQNFETAQFLLFSVMLITSMYVSVHCREEGCQIGISHWRIFKNYMFLQQSFSFFGGGSVNAMAPGSNFF